MIILIELEYNCYLTSPYMLIVMNLLFVVYSIIAFISYIVIIYSNILLCIQMYLLCRLVQFY